MLALVTAANKPERIELREVPPPFPAPNEALLEIRAFGVNRGELRLLESRPDGWRPGQDVSGIVGRPAADGSGPRQGQRVVALADQAGWAEMAPVLVTRIAPIPDNVSFQSAAALPVAGLTALRALRLGGMLLGKRVLITGASGGVGQFAVQFAALAGAEVTAVARPERAHSIRDLGAATVVADVEDLQGTFNVILESVGGKSLSAAARLVGADGALVFFGNSSREQSNFSFADFGGHPRARLLPFHVYESGPPAFAADLELMAKLVGAGQLKPLVGFQGSWRSMDAALAELRDRQFSGKAVLTLP
jgi:NADPH:quinone reductase